MICPVCNNESIQMLDLGFQPASLTELNAPSGNLVRVNMYICQHCSHVFNSAFDPDTVSYSDGCYMYNDGVEWQEHVEEILASLPDNYDSVIEIGAGDCKFLNRVRGNNKIAIDPASPPFHVPYGTKYVQEEFTVSRLPTAGSRLIIMRHFLEHLHSPRRLLASIFRHSDECSDPTCIYLEVPCCENALNQLRVEDWTYEHPQHFTETSLRQLLVGLCVDQHTIWHAYGGEVLCCLINIGGSLDTSREIVTAYKNMSFNIRNLKKLIARDAYAFCGGAGKSAVFINMLQLPDDSLVVDSDENKWGKLVPGTSIEIKAPYEIERVAGVIATTSWRAKDILSDMRYWGVEVPLYKVNNGRLWRVASGN